MKISCKNLVRTLFVMALMLSPLTTHAGANKEEAKPLADRVLGKDTAPITVIEYSSFTCSHCADFHNKVMPEIEKNYVDTGKVRFIFREFPADAYALKGAALARCMPQEQYFPFVRILFKTQGTWMHAPKPDETLLQYAQMAGLTSEKAKACLEDNDLLNSIVAGLEIAKTKYDVTGTPTFIINDGAETIVGMRDYASYATMFDALLAQKK